MKRKIIIPISAVFLGLIVYLTVGFKTAPSASTITDDYIVLAWNDLGMHCANADFSDIVILPPYNNFNAQVIKRGDASKGVKPVVISSGLEVLYSIPGNTYSVGKTNFWSYEDKLFGVNLPDNIGLAGKGLSGTMDVPTGENFYHVEGVPITPFTDNDLKNEDPYQLALVEVMMGGNKVGETKSVMPVSNEINCLSSGCHSSTNDIKNRHSDSERWPKPVLCASCHSSNALGAPGKAGVMSLSEAIHTKHKDKTSDCYKCHPGPNTQCLRDVMSTQHNMSCTDCHGGMKQMSESIHNGRRPWIDEPKCGTCHKQYSEETGKLYRNSKGHGGLFCTTCHGSPHAILPSREENDNLQNFNLQGYAGTLSDCKVCHTTNPTGAGPHGIYAQQETVDADKDGYNADVDCNDNDSLINPGAVEIWDNIDNNCNGEIDEGLAETQQVPLSAGWNIMSFRVMPENNNLHDILQSLIDDGKLKKVIDESGKVIEDWGYFGGWQNTIGKMQNSEGYKINVSTAAILETKGRPVQFPYNIALLAGWNIISWPSPNEQNGMDVFRTLINEGKLKKVIDESGKVIENWGFFGDWQNNIGNFKPGEGYKVNVTEACTLTVLESGTKSEEIIPELIPSTHFVPVYQGNGTDHMNINLVNLAESGIVEGDEIGIFDGPVCVGSAQIPNLQSSIVNQYSAISIPVSATDGNEGKNGYSEGNQITIKLFRNGKGSSVLIEPLNNSKIVFKKGSSLFAQIDLTTGLVGIPGSTMREFKCYPNPFSEELTIELNLTTDAEVEIEVLNLLGQTIKYLVKKQKIASGIKRYTWNGENTENRKVVPGIYYIRVNVNGNNLNKKIVLTRK